MEIITTVKQELKQDVLGIVKQNEMASSYKLFESVVWIYDQLGISCIIFSRTKDSQ